MDKAKKFNKAFKKATRAGNIFEAVLLVENGNGDFSYSKGYGEKHVNSPLFMEGITKLFTTAVILRLVQNKKLFLGDKVSDYFDSETMKGLHIYKGADYSLILTVENLLFQSSGLPCSFEEATSIHQRIANANKPNNSFEEVISRTKKLNPHFAPCNDNAFYTNVNFDLLGKIIEKVLDAPLHEVFAEHIFDPLQMSDTYIPIDEEDFIPKIYFKDEAVLLNETIIASPASGAGVSTARDLMIFLKAFFRGKLFNKAIFNRLDNYRKLQTAMGPVSYGGGYMQIPLEGAVTFFKGKGELLGHSGLTGAFAFYYPLEDLFFVGDVNQMENPATPIKLAIRLAKRIK